ncbi:MAG: MBL fold metallo-hydrolase [Thermoprotei archaeon]
MDIKLISFDSMGTRSMATFVETDDVNILIDPGVALGPFRYGLPPHPLEIEKLKNDWTQIVYYASKCDVIIITHYHYDHHNPKIHLDLYNGKEVLIKHPSQKINRSQFIRSSFFIKQLGNRPKSLNYADGKEFSYGRTLIKFSQPVPHGADERLGYVIEVLIDDGNHKLLFTSDIEGAVSPSQVEFIIKHRPDTIIMDGPMTYMLGTKFSENSYVMSINNITKILDVVHPKDLIIDHHLLRDLQWNERIRKVINRGNEVGTHVLSAAEYSGEKISILEARRKELYKQNPVDHIRRFSVFEDFSEE